MISRVNEAFQECITTSWYGKLNETYHLKKETWLKKSSLVMPYSAQRMTQMCWKVAISPTEVRRLVYACVQRKEGLQRLTVERIQNTSLHRWLTPYKCLSLCLHAHPAAGDNSGTLNNAEPAKSHYRASGFKGTAGVVYRWELKN